MWKKKFAASSANLGPGFDSYGIALQKFLTVEAQPAATWSVTYRTDFMEHLPNDERNMVLTIARQVARRYQKELRPLALVMTSEIPLTHGMGSSASAIVAGIELANDFAELNLSQDDKIRIASEIEGHPDNVGACITGGLFVGYHQGNRLYYQTARFDQVGVIISTPHYELSTKEARAVLPKQYTKSDSIAQNALSSVMLLALMNGDYRMMGELMMQDKFHEPYRQELIEEFADVKQIALEQGAYATVISGAGPSILTLCPLERIDSILAALQAQVKCEHQAIDIWYAEQ